MFKNSLKIKNLKFKIRKLGKKTLTGLLTLILVILPVTLLILFNNPKGVEAAWADEEWGYRKSIAITAHTSSENNVYISTTISNTNTLVTNGQLQSDCGDLRFTKQNGEVLPYYISSGCNSASTVVQVFFNTFPAGAQTIYFYYGNPSAVNGFRSTAFSTEATSHTIGSTGSEEKAPSPVAYWKFDDGTGTTAQDSTTNNNDGTLTNGPTWQTEDMCVSGKCLKFDGSNDIVNSSNSIAYASSTITLSFWTRINSYGASNQIIFESSTNYNDNDKAFVAYTNTSGSLLFGIQDSSTTNKYRVESITGPSLNTWHFFTVVYDNSTSTGDITVYMDGISQTTTITTNDKDQSGNFASFPLYIGARSGGTSAFSGFIDEPKIYNYARSSAQILADFNSRSSSEGLSANIGNSDQGKSLSNGLVGYWKMDESSGNATDSSGNNYTGTAIGTTVSTGKYGSGRSFNGTGDYFNVSSFTVNTTLNNGFTLSAWAKHNSSSGGWSWVFGSSQTNWFQFGKISGSGNLRFEFPQSNNLDTTDINMADGNWHHIVATWNGSVKKVYVDGVFKVELAYTGTMPNYGNLYIGAHPGPTENWNGNIDETRIYNRALSPAEVSQLYNFAPGPVAYYNFEENTGTTVNDRSGNGNTGTWNGSGSPKWKPGKYGTAGNFDGSTDYVDIGNPSILSNLSMGTISGWFYVNDLSSIRSIFSYSNGTSTEILNPSILTDGSFNVQLKTGNADILLFYTPAGTIQTNRWYHFAFTVSSTGNALYLDGKPASVTYTVGNASTSKFFSHVSGNTNRIGRLVTNYDRYFSGQIDDVKIYNYARTQQQIVEDMNAGHPPPGSPVSSPVGHWKFDEGYSTTANNSGNGGSTINGTLTNMASPATSTSGWTQSGKVGKGLVFDGTNDYVAISDNSALSASNITVSAWVNPTVNGSNNMVVAKRETNFEYQFFVGNGEPNFTIFSAGTGTGTTVTSSQTLSTGVWSHIVGTYDGSTVKVYVNGRLTGSASSSYVMSDTNSPVYIGIDNTTTGRYFNGSIDEVKFYNFALTADQIKMDMNQGAAAVYGNLGNASTSSANSAAQEYCVPGDTATCTAPVGRWDFEEGTGTTVNDSSGSNLTGTWNGSGTRWANGKYGKTGKFNGTDDYVTMGDTSIVDFGTGNFTLEAWVKLGSLTQGRGMIIAKDNSGASGRQFALEWDGNDNNSNFIRIGYFYSDPGQVWLDTANNIITDTNWHHISAGRSGNSLFVYIDGILKASGTTGGSHASMQATASQLRVGNRQYSGATDELNGSIDQVRIYNYARSSSQIKWSYNKGAPVTHWKLDECQGTTINDASGTVNGTWSGSGGSQTSAGTCQTASTAWGNGVTGKRNYSLNFDGTDDRVSFTVPSVFNLASGGSMSLSAWIKTSTDGRGILQLQNGNPLIYLQTGNTTSGGTANKFVAYIRDDSGTIQAIPINGVTTVTDNNWHNVAFVIDNTNLYLYVDGRRETSTTWAGGAVTVGGSTGYLGDLNNATNWEFSGQIDDFRVYNYALSATQIKNLYNDGTANYSPVTGAP